MPFAMPFVTAPSKKNNNIDLSVHIPQQMTAGMPYNGTNGPNSPAPFIKNEPQDESHRFSQGGFNHHQNNYDSHFDQDFGGAGSINPSDLSMPVQQNNGFMHGMGSLGSGGFSYMGGGGGVGDDDLLATLSPDSSSNHFENNHHNNFGNQHGMNTVDSVLHDLNGENGFSETQNTNHHQFSHTPDAAQAGSPYINSLPQQFTRLQSYNGPGAETPSSYNPSPIIGSNSTQGTSFDHYMNKRKARPSMMERTASQPGMSMSPAPKTPIIAGLSLGPESASVPSKPILGAASHLGHRKSLSSHTHWDGTPGSYMESPLSSPGHGPGHPSMAEMFSAKHASLPTKVDAGATFNSQEAKRRRRRESHNMVERRRRDNINERIQELSHLVPHHRLEDEKVRKQLINNGSLSPTTGASGSPPRATSMLAGGIGRRASGVATTGLTGEEKDKGPNKGDILNGAVGWTRDLMWALNRKYEQEKKVRELFAQLGRKYPFEQTEEDKRMESELQKAVGKNGVGNFRYSRAPGSNLRVPGYTDYAGQPVERAGSEESQGKEAGEGTGAAGQGGSGGQGGLMWPGTSGEVFKEEDEFTNMDMT